MGYKNTRRQEASRVCWGKLEAGSGARVRGWIQSLLEEEVTELHVQRPRVRGLKERLRSRTLPLFARRTGKVGALLPDHGLSQGDFELARRGLLGEKAPLSANTVARLKQKWQAEYEKWSFRSLQDLEVVYLSVDGV